MRKFRICRYGLFDHIFDVQVKLWYVCIVIKRFKADISNVDQMPNNITYCKMLAEELLEKLEED